MFSQASTIHEENHRGIGEMERAWETYMELLQIKWGCKTKDDTEMKGQWISTLMGFRKYEIGSRKKETLKGRMMVEIKSRKGCNLEWEKSR